MPPGRTFLDKKGLGQDKLAAIWSLLICSTLPRRKKKGEREEEEEEDRQPINFFATNFASYLRYKVSVSQAIIEIWVLRFLQHVIHVLLHTYIL